MGAGTAFVVLCCLCIVCCIVCAMGASPGEPNDTYGGDGYGGVQEVVIIDNQPGYTEGYGGGYGGGETVVVDTTEVVYEDN